MLDDVKPGHLMAAESAQALEVFANAARQSPQFEKPRTPKAVYTIARGSSDAAANILSYEFMRELRVPTTSLPPSVFSLGVGVVMDGAHVMLISQSGASEDLVRSAEGARAAGARVLAITNQPGSPVEKASDVTLPIGAGDERAVPATKTVCGAIGAGMAALAALVPGYGARAKADAEKLEIASLHHPRADAVQAAFLRARHVYVIGRDTGYGAAIETALKLKECCAIHAEAYSASEVLHGPLQLATNPLMILILDTETDATQDSLDQAEARFKAEGCDVHRLRPSDMGVGTLTPTGAAAYLLALMYPVILKTALALGLDPDAPQTLSKVTQTR